MAKLNKAIKKDPIYTHEGAKAHRITPYQQLRRSVCSCMLWEKEFYEDGQTIADRIADTVKQCKPEDVAALTIEARENFKLRHVPLLLCRELARQGYKGTSKTLSNVIQRADELTEFLSIYWKESRCPLSAQVKKGLAAAFTKFNAYNLTKYNRDGAIKLRDVLFLCHAKPISDDQAETWKKLIAGTLESPDTWEVSLSAGNNKKEVWERLLSENKLGGLALLRNLRNMQQSGVKKQFIFNALNEMRTDRILPFRFIAAAKYAPQWEDKIEPAMLKCVNTQDKLNGHTVLLVDVSGSMDWALSAKSDLSRMDAANGLAILLGEICENVSVYSFSNYVQQIPPRKGFALRDAIKNSQPHSGTYLGKAITAVNNNKDCDRIIVITDEQSHDYVPSPNGLGYMINVASNRNGVGYGTWKHIDGFSEAVVNWIQEYERL